MNEFAALLRDFCGRADRRPRHLPPADGPRAAGLDAGLRPAGRHPLRGVRRLQRRGVRRPDRRLAEPHPGDDGRLLPQRRADRPQGQGRRGGGGRPRARASRSTRCWSGAGTPASTRRRARWSTAATSSSTSCCGDYRGQLVEPVSMPAEAPLFLMYTSGTTGRPKGCQHSTGGYLAYVAGTSKYYQDIHPEDTYWCFADIGWITGHSYIVYGPLSLGHDERDVRGRAHLSRTPGRPWRIAERLGVNIFHTAPTDDPHAAQARPGRAGEVRLPLQAHDHGGRADRAGRLALVPRRRRQGRGGRSSTPGGRPRTAASSAAPCPRCSR